jgi:hypothetical protein
MVLFYRFPVFEPVNSEWLAEASAGMELRMARKGNWKGPEFLNHGFHEQHGCGSDLRVGVILWLWALVVRRDGKIIRGKIIFSEGCRCGG